MYREPVIHYEMDVAEADVALGSVQRLAECVLRELDQEAVYVTVAPVDALSVIGVATT